MPWPKPSGSSPTPRERSPRHARWKPITTPEAIAVAKAAWQAEQASARAVATLKATERNSEPITVFVSKKTGRVYIRQAWAPVHEAPATFKDPETPWAPTSMSPGPRRTTAGRCAGFRSRCLRHARPSRAGTPSAAPRARPPRHRPPPFPRPPPPRCRAVRAAGGDTGLHRRQAVGGRFPHRLQRGHEPRNRGHHRFHRGDALADRFEHVAARRSNSCHARWDLFTVPLRPIVPLEPMQL